MVHKPHDKFLKLVEDQLGKDFGSDIIEEVAHHMEDCPDCKIYVDSVNQTIRLYRETEDQLPIPGGVTDRLFKLLDLKEKN